MRRSAYIWIGVAALYGAFLFWYDGGGGPTIAVPVEPFLQLGNPRWVLALAGVALAALLALGRRAA